jgi:nucleotide-binding universal stress UspA family protein
MRAQPRGSGGAAELAERLGRELMQVHVDAGDPVEELARAVDARRARLAAVGTRGRGPLRVELLGSVSAGLVRAAGRPAMLVSQAAR